MVSGIVIIMLFIEAISDIRTQTVSCIRLVAFGILGIAINYSMTYQSISSILGGVIVGIILIAYAFLSKGAVGLGDGAVFICLGIYLGLSDNMRLLFFSLIGAAIGGVIYGAVSKKGLKVKIPFLPCILLAYVGMVVMEVLF